MRELVSELAMDADGFAWLQGFLPWLRDGGNMRTAPVVLAAEAVRARLAAGLEGGNRQLAGSVRRRTDEPGEMLAYWTSRYGRAVPKPVKRGIADAVARLYDDVIDLVHPSPPPAYRLSVRSALATVNAIARGGGAAAGAGGRG